MPVLSLANQKGGVGKTTTAINLASALAEKSKRVLLIDIDPQGNATTSLGFNRREVIISTYEVLIEGSSSSSAIIPTIQDNLFLLPANDNLPGAEVELAERPDRSQILKNAIFDIRLYYDFILIDCPPSLGILTLNSLVASDGILIPMQAEFLAMEGLTQLLSTFDIVRQQLNPQLEILGVLFTMYDGRTRLTREIEEEVRKFFGGTTTVFKSVIPRTVRLAEAPSHGLPITIYASSSNAAEAYRSLATEVINVTEARIRKGFESSDTASDGADSHRDGSIRPPGGNLDVGDKNIPDQTESPPAPSSVP